MTHHRQPVSLLAVRARRGEGLRASGSGRVATFLACHFSGRRGAVRARAECPAPTRSTLSVLPSLLLALRLP
jgi:hypothetical protein